MELPKISATELAIGAGAIALVSGVAAVAIVRSRRKKSRKRKATKRKNSRKRVRRGKKLKFGSKAYRKKYLHKRKRSRHTPYTARKGKDTSHKRIRYTKKGQPYVIQSNGRARFIKKSSAKSSYKRKGGRY